MMLLQVKCPKCKLELNRTLKLTFLNFLKLSIQRYPLSTKDLKLNLEIQFTIEIGFIFAKCIIFITSASVLKFSAFFTKFFLQVNIWLVCLLPSYNYILYLLCTRKFFDYGISLTKYQLPPYYVH